MEKNLCRPGFALPLLMALLFAAAPAHAQELGIETVPSQPRALQEFEVWYTAGGEIESIEMPCWGSLTLVRELGRTSGTQTSVRDGVMTRSETHAYRYLVRSAVGGELVIPGTTAVVGGQTCRCDGLRVKILPALVSVQPQCRIVYDSVVSRRMGGHILRLTCDRRPDRRVPLLAVNGEDVAPLMSGYSEKNGLEEFVYHYRVAGDGPGTYSCVPRLSFGGREFAAEPYVVTVKPASAAVSFGRWWLYVPVGALLALWGAVFVRDHTVAAGRNAVVSRFSWRGYMLLALALLFVGFSAVFLCLLFAPGAKPFALYLAAAVMLFGSCWLVFGGVAALGREVVPRCRDALRYTLYGAGHDPQVRYARLRRCHHIRPCQPGRSVRIPLPAERRAPRGAPLFVLPEELRAAFHGHRRLLPGQGRTPEGLLAGAEGVFPVAATPALAGCRPDSRRPVRIVSYCGVSAACCPMAPWSRGFARTVPVPGRRDAAY